MSYFICEQKAANRHTTDTIQNRLVENRLKQK